MDWRVDFYEARYHLNVAKRMLESYEEYTEKRILVGVIREAAKASGRLVRTFLIRENVRGDMGTFVKDVAPKYLDSVTINSLIKILEIEREHRIARVEFLKERDILMEVDGKWKVLRFSRLQEFVNSIGSVIGNFPTDIKR